MRTALLIPLFALATAAYASEWVPVTTTAEGDTHSYDSEKLHVEDRTIVYWRKVDLRMPLPVRSGLAQQGLFREQIDCVGRSLRTLGYLYYAADGGLIENVYEPDAPPVPIADGTPMRRLEELLCPMVRAATTEPQPPAESGDGLVKPRQEVEALQARVRDLRRGLELQEAAGSGR